MIKTGFETRVKVQQIIENQLPEFLRSESPKSIDFLKQYYISQEYQGGPADLANNLDQYLKFDNLTPEVIGGTTTLSSDINATETSVTVSSVKGFPTEYGLFQIDDEIFTYTGITGNTFTGCVRGFSAITSYKHDLDPEELIFSDSDAASHTSGSTVKNLSAEFLREFYNKLKYTFVPGLENVDFVSDLDVNTFITHARNLYQSKGTEESFKILFKVLYGITPKIVDLEDYLLKPSSARFLRRENVVVERISGDPYKLIGQTIRKSSDSETQASVSEVDIITVAGQQTYYKLSLFIGYDDRDTIEGTFAIQPKVSAINSVAAGGSVITVDTTIGFPSAGTLISGDNVIQYSSKSVNQFLDCTGIENDISVKDEIRINETFYGYEEGDIAKRVDVRLTGVLAKVREVTDIKGSSEGQIIYIKNVGEKIQNPESNRSHKQIFANSWNYNTSSRYSVSTINGSEFVLKSSLIGDVTLNVGDAVDIVDETTETISHVDAVVADITGNTVTLNNLAGFVVSPSANYAIRRKLKTASSSSTPLKYGNDVLVSNIQNLYNENDEYFYVASNSLPSYSITKSVSKSSIPSANSSTITGYDNITEKYSVISFDNSVPFITGDEVYYSASGEELIGLPEGSYYVKVLTPNNKIRLYLSRALIETDTYLEFSFNNLTVGSHSFTLITQKDEEINPQKILKKFPADKNITFGNDVKTIPGSSGLLANGVEIINYKSRDKVYYGPLDKITTYNNGSGYDVVNPPVVEVSSPTSGTTALVQPVLSGHLEEVIVDPQEFDIEKIISVSLIGGNGNGAVLDPIVTKRYREVEFDARSSEYGGGVNLSLETITFSTSHNFKDGEPIVYNRNGNNAIGVGPYQGSDAVTGEVLSNGSVYYPKVISSTTIQLYESLSDYNSGINTVGFTTAITSGSHKFRTFNSKNTLNSIKVINPGSGYQNRKLFVKPDNVSTVEDTIIFENHGFSDGDIVNYDTTGTPIGGLSTSNRYYIIKKDSDTFRLADAGIGATITSNYTRGDYVDLTGVGSGYHTFSYPNIEVIIDAEYDGSVGSITATPVVVGEITDIYLYENGSGYGSKTLNFHKKPNIAIKNGKDAEVRVIISNGKITSAFVVNAGSEYYSSPDLIVTGKGVGAKLRAVVSSGLITGVVVINGGSGYDADTTVSAVAKGSNAYAEAQVRSLTLNNYSRFGDEILFENQDNNQGLEYGLVGYYQSLKDEFLESSTQHSKLIGWAYDGNPIYGSYAYSDADDIDSEIKALESGYILQPSSVVDRPSGFASGLFVEDYQYVGGKDLDQYNGRYCKTPEFPNGVYAYFASINAVTQVSTFPYFIGNSFKSLPIDQTYNQDFDFNSSNLIRNTFPYKVSEKYADNDFITESNEFSSLLTTIDSVVGGKVDKLRVNSAGSGYAVGDVAVFDNTNTNGGGLSASVKSILGRKIVDVTTTVDSYQSAKIIWENSNTVSLHIDKVNSVSDGDFVSVSNLSSYVKNLSGLHSVDVSAQNTYLIKDIPSNATPGVVTDFYVSQIPSSLSIGSTIGIGTEKLSVINIFKNDNVVRALRGITGTAHTASTEASVLTGKISLNVTTPYFDSRLNDKVYFNPSQSLGIGSETGISTSVNYTIGDVTETVSVPTQSIYLPNHPFKTAQTVILEKVGANPVSVSNTSGSAQFNIPSGSSQTLYVINKSKDYIGLTTEVGLTTNTNGLYFQSFTSNGDDTDYQYSLESNFNQVTGTVSEINSSVQVLSQHSLEVGDEVTLNIVSNQSVGIGTSAAIIVKYNQQYNKLLINPVGFTSIAVNTDDNSLSIQSHGLLNGDKIFYNSSDEVISGLNTGSYYVYKIDDNTINLSETYYDALSSPPSVVSFASTGGSGHELSKISPEIRVIKNNNLVFDVSDSSLSGYNFKVYEDSNFYNELISTGESSSFNVIGVGTVGVSTNASVTLNYGSSLPYRLFYNLEKGGYISTSDRDVKNGSQIIFADSTYNKNYKISSVSSTTFTISLNEIPEILYYDENNTSTLEYSTTSLNETGGVNSMNIESEGVKYKKLPKFVNIQSVSGSGADITPQSSNIGKNNQIAIQNQGFDFSSDKTLSPEAFISPYIDIINNYKLESVDIEKSGSNYPTAPDLIAVDADGNIYQSGLLEAQLQGTGISQVDILDSPKGLSNSNIRVFAVNNSNGVGIKSITSFNPSSITFSLTTPVLGFTTDAFVIGEKVFVENIVKYGDDGDGFNSADYNYNLFPIIGYTNSNPAVLQIDISEYGTNPGIAVTIQNSYASVIREEDYPVFSTNKALLEFKEGEKLLVLKSGSYVEVDLIVTENSPRSIKVYGTYELKKSDIIFGKTSGTIATINDIVENRAFFEVDYSNRADIGWSNDIGKLDTDYQVIPDNDYYQNLSYSIRSSKEYEDIVTPVNSILHTSGLKNFSDTEITQAAVNGISSAIAASSDSLITISDEKRVDTVKNFDFGLDIDTFNSKSKFVRFQNERLSSFIDCKTNRVLPIDNINGSFSASDGDTELFVDVIDFNRNSGYNKFLIQIRSTDGTQLQASELIAVDSFSFDIITAQKGVVYNTSSEIGELIGFINPVTGQLSIRFTPDDPFNIDYDIKVIRNNFITDLAGNGSSSIGFIDLISDNTSVSAASTETIFSSSIANTKSLLINAEIKNLVTRDINYVEVYVDHNGTDTYISEYYLDNADLILINNNFDGEFSAEISGGNIVVNYNNQDTDNVLVRTKIIGFGQTSAGIGTYTFVSDGQDEIYAKTAIFQSNYETISGISTVISVSKTDISAIKSYVRVGYGQTSALHQFIAINDGNDTNLIQYPFMDNGQSTGIGTFGSEIDGSNLIIKFYPDVVGIVTVQTYSELIKSDIDFVNIPNNLTYGTITESFNVSPYNSRNGERANILDFELKSKGTSIFQKTFNPSDTNILDISTGTFTINDHFFSDGEKLEYASASSFIGAPFSDIQVAGGGNLPSEVYAINDNKSQFKLASSKANALSGIALTYTSVGQGNAHTLQMTKRNEKTVLVVDDVVQSPIAFTNKTTDLVDNGGSIDATSTFFSVTGISSLYPGDLIKFDNEYIEVKSVGIGTTSLGPITETGSFKIVEGIRGAVGSSTATHTDATTGDVYSGAFNIVNNRVYFTEAPRGNSSDPFNDSNLPTPRSNFSGRVYLRNDYTTNKVYDDITKEFTGIGATYTITVGGANTTGIETGSGLLFINDIFQTPSTENNAGNNYEYIESAGISSITFTGITTIVGGDLFISDYDINQNQLPRGGVIVSLGSTPGLGYAPLVGAFVTAVVSGGSIVSVGLGTTDYNGSGYNGVVSIGVSVFEEGHVGDVASISATVGAGGTLSFTVDAGGTGYTNPQIFVSEPSYENLEVTGVSRRGIGATTDTGTGLLVSVEIGASTRTGIGSTLFEVTNFKIARPGYGFKVGDVFTPVGLVTDVNIPSVIEQFELTVLDTFTDSFSSWQFGELDFIDPITNLQDGNRLRFPLYYNANLLSFETFDADIDLAYLLLIFINGVLQNPNESYTFDGGTSFAFTEAPKEEDKIAIFFYRGTRNDDSILVENFESIKPGDTIQLKEYDVIPSTITQDERTVFNIVYSDTIETSTYSNVGIDEVNYKPLDWKKQKADIRLSGEVISKSRDSIESQIYPTARIIADVSAGDTEIFVDDAQFFNYEENESSIVISDVDAIIIKEDNFIPAEISATVSAAGTISSLTIVDGGFGYTGSSVSISIASPPIIGVGIGTTATATASISGGSITSTTIVNSGFGYTQTNPPSVLVPSESVSYENVTEISAVLGSSGIVTGITTTTGIGAPLALQFYLYSDSPYTGLTAGYPIFINETGIGDGLISIDTSDSDVIGIGTSFANNIYKIQSFSDLGSGNALIVANIDSTTNTVGLETYSSPINPVGRFSWGRLSALTRSSSPISIGVTGLTIDSGLSTFPIIQRRGYGLRNNGSLRKDLG